MNITTTLTTTGTITGTYSNSNGLIFYGQDCNYYTIPFSTYPIQFNYPVLDTCPTIINNTYSIENTEMTTKYLDDKFQIIIELAGFKKNEINVKYLPDSENKISTSYIEIKASSKTHLLKKDDEESFDYSLKYNLSTTKEYKFFALKVNFNDGLLIIEIPYKDSSIVREATIE